MTMTYRERFMKCAEKFAKDGLKHVRSGDYLNATAAFGNAADFARIAMSELIRTDDEEMGGGCVEG